MRGDFQEQVLDLPEREGEGWRGGRVVVGDHVKGAVCRGLVASILDTMSDIVLVILVFVLRSLTSSSMARFTSRFTSRMSRRILPSTGAASGCATFTTTSTASVAVCCGLTSVLPPTFFITSCERLTVRLSRSVAGRAHAATRQCRTRRAGGSLCCTNSRAGGSLFTVKFVLLGLGLLPPVNLEQRVVACQTQSLSKETGSGGGGGEGEEFIQNCIREARFVARWDQHAVSNRQP